MPSVFVAATGATVTRSECSCSASVPCLARYDRCRYNAWARSACARGRSWDALVRASASAGRTRRRPAPSRARLDRGRAETEQGVDALGVGRRRGPAPVGRSPLRPLCRRARRGRSRAWRATRTARLVGGHRPAVARVVDASQRTAVVVVPAVELPSMSSGQARRPQVRGGAGRATRRAGPMAGRRSSPHRRGHDPQRLVRLVRVEDRARPPSRSRRRLRGRQPSRCAAGGTTRRPRPARELLPQEVAEQLVVAYDPGRRSRT